MKTTVEKKCSSDVSLRTHIQPFYTNLTCMALSITFSAKFGTATFIIAILSLALTAPWSSIAAAQDKVSKRAASMSILESAIAS
mmetsp:Transcript_8072/g.10078  ORF Transcript_8072/g.10078 Transcript_8072/m.10078 type:complete len:84 (-) Transcript_8072:623-874(-)